MHIITRQALASFWLRYKDSELPLKSWHSICEKTDFPDFASLRQTFGSVDKVGKFTVFNIGGNKYRLITIVHYQRRKIYVRHVLTHREYDRDHWKRA